MTPGVGQGKKPVDLVAAQSRGCATGQDAVWGAVRRLKRFTANDLWMQVEKHQGDNRHTIRSYLKRLLRGGYLEVVDVRQRGVAKTYTYELVRDVGVDAPRLDKSGEASRQGVGTEQMWRAMRILGKFTYLDLAIGASTGSHSVKPATAKDYCKYLAWAGYLKVLSLGKAGTPSVYVFVASKFTGPKPPKVQRVRQVFDPNINQVVWPEKAEETDD